MSEAWGSAFPGIVVRRNVRNRSEASDMRPESTALNVMDRIDALAVALRDAGVPAEQCSGLLASAATAAMHAVTLDAVLEGAPAAPAAPEPALVAIEAPAALAA